MNSFGVTNWNQFLALSMEDRKTVLMSELKDKSVRFLAQEWGTNEQSLSDMKRRLQVPKKDGTLPSIPDEHAKWERRKAKKAAATTAPVQKNVPVQQIPEPITIQSNDGINDDDVFIRMTPKSDLKGSKIIERLEKVAGMLSKDYNYRIFLKIQEIEAAPEEVKVKEVAAADEVKVDTAQV